MGQQILQQPDGKFAVFSTVVDAFIITDATEEELIEWRVQEAAERARQHTRLELDLVKDPNKLPYFQFTLTWDEAFERDKENQA